MKTVDDCAFPFYWAKHLRIEFFFEVSKITCTSPFRGLYFEKHLKFIKLNTKFVPFTKMDLSYLEKVSGNPCKPDNTGEN